MEYNVLELSKCSDSHRLLYAYNKRIGCDLDNEHLNEWLYKILSVGDPLGIVINDEIIAFLMLYCNNEETLEAYICNVYVDSQYRGMKLSANLIDTAIRICRERNFKCINLDVAESNIPALKIYMSCGFVETERYCINTEYKLKMTYYL